MAEDATNPLSLDKLLPAMRKARTAIGNIPTSGHNKFDDYDYSSMKDFADAVETGIKDFGLVVVVEDVKPEHFNTGRDKMPNGCRVTITGHVWHESGQRLLFSFPGEAFDRGDKALYKAVTGARKYGLACLFNLKAGTDPESDEGVSKAAAEGEAPRRPATPEPPPRPTLKQQMPAAETPDALATLLLKAEIEHPPTAATAEHYLKVLEGAAAIANARAGGDWKDADFTKLHDTLESIRTNVDVVRAALDAEGAAAF